MAKTVNQVTLLGNVGRAPEVKATRSGHTVASFSIATSNRYKDQSGQWKDEPEWHNCVAWGKLAEIIRDYVGKGSKLFVQGRLKTRSWDDSETGKKRHATEVNVSDVTLLGAPMGRAATNEDAEEPGYAYTRDSVADDPDIPF